MSRRFPDADLSQAERSAAVARRRHFRALALADGRRHPLTSVAHAIDVNDVPDSVDLEAQVLDRLAGGLSRLEIRCLVTALARLAETETDRHNLQAYASNVLADEPRENPKRKWLQRFRAKHAAQLRVLREVWQMLRSA